MGKTTKKRTHGGARPPQVGGEARLRFNVGRALRLLGCCAASCFVYFAFAGFGVGVYVPLVYMLVCALIAVIYVVYNRGFVYRGVSADMLDPSLTDEERIEIVSQSRTREKKSKWMLEAFIAAVLPLIADIFKLFVIDALLGK